MLETYRAFVIDVDGVLVRGSRPLDGAAQALQTLRCMGRILILTNNSTRSRQQHADRLCQMGFRVEPSDIVSSSFIAAQHLKCLAGPTSVWVLGENGLQDELQAAGHHLSATPTDADWIVAGMDRSLTYQALGQALDAAEAGAKLLATNTDGTYPTPAGLQPGAGAIVGALRGMGLEPVVSVGKPESIAYSIALKQLALPAEEALMIGDRLETDILGGNDAGMDTLMVLTGISSKADIARTGIHPTWLAESLWDAVSGDAVAVVGDEDDWTMPKGET